ncbi:MAG TPA: hypothetical protein VF933_37100 [Streptosporangiaceae bacterium]
MHPYLMEQQIKARNEDLHRELARPRRERARRGARPRPSLRHDLGWMLVGVGLRMALGRSGLRGGQAARRGSGPVITHG